MITAFVLLMMVIIEYLNVQTKNSWTKGLKGSPYLQIIIAAVAGIIPGCMGAFAVVSLYTHRIVGLAAVVTAMIATSGDGAFVMFAMFPGKALLINALLFSIAVITGFIIHLLLKNKITNPQNGFVIHEEDHCKCFDRIIIIKQLKRMTFERAILIFTLLIFTLALIFNYIGPEEWNWKKLTFLIGALFLLFVFTTVPEHFLKEHLYNHIIKKHLFKIFLWSWAAFIGLHFISTNEFLTELLNNNLYIILIIAVLIGLIPDSGPHLIFATLFSQNLLPFSILMANSIVQDGHGMLPLLAESRNSFFKVKAINMLVGFIVGLILLLFNL